MISNFVGSFPFANPSELDGYLRDLASVAKKILIVDDSPVIRETVRFSLERHFDWQVCGEAVNGLDALHKAQESHPDIVVLDLSMPVMDGLKAARHLRQTMPSVSIVMFTSHDSPQLRHEATAAGIPKVVSKDSPLGTLTDAIEELLQPEAPGSDPSESPQAQQA